MGLLLTGFTLNIPGKIVMNIYSLGPETCSFYVLSHFTNNLQK